MNQFQEAAKQVATIAHNINVYDDWEKAEIYRLIQAGKALHRAMLIKPVANWKDGHYADDPRIT